jgi:hypothetical protein
MRWILLCFLAAALGDQAPVQTIELKGTTHHVQGIDLDATRLWVTSVDQDAKKGYLHEFALPSGELRRTVEVGTGTRFHPGGMARDGDSLWLPVAEYRRESSAIIQQRNAKTLELEMQFEVADHIGCVAAGPDFVVGGNWDSRLFYVWDKHGKLLRNLENSAGNAYQDLKFVDGKLVGGGLLPGKVGAVDWLEWPSLRLEKRVQAGKTDRGVPYTNEGMAVRGDRLFLLPEDGPSRLFEFRVEGL